MFQKLEEISDRYRDLDQRIVDPEFMKDQAAYQKALRERGSLAKIAETFEEYKTLKEKIAGAEDIIEEREDEELVLLAREELDELHEREGELVEALKCLLVQDETFAGKNVIVEIRAGTGGNEASLFAGDLFRLSQRFADSNGLKLEVLAASHSEVGGFREIVFSVSGKKAWDLFRFEIGGHRVQRVPVTESQGRIHTSAATVAVLPEVGEVEVDIKDNDLKIETYRAGGPGGQNVNKVASAIRITHLPTGLVVQCQDESSQHKNRSKAMRILNARYYDMERTRLENERAAERRDQIGTGDRNMRIRTYNFPQNRVTDHRTKTNYSLEMVLQGALDRMIAALVEWDRSEKLKNLKR